MNKKIVKTLFIAQCGNKYIYEWVEPQFSMYVWYDYPTEFETKDKCLEAIGSTMRNSEKPNSPVIIKELRKTMITEIVREHVL